MSTLHDVPVGLRNPRIMRSKGSRIHDRCTRGRKLRKSTKCGICKQEGHNRRCCLRVVEAGYMAESVTRGLEFEIHTESMRFEHDEILADNASIYITIYNL